jgi:TP901 family phage tail tape measure protein
VAFVLDVNLRIQDILGLGKVEAALAKLKGAAPVGAAAVGGAAVVGGAAGGMTAASKAQATAVLASAAATNKATVANNKLTASQTKATHATRKAAGGLKTAAKSADSFGRSVVIAGKRYGAFLTATIIPFAVIGGLGKATAAVIEFDTAVLRMRQITGQTEQQIAGMRSIILDLATTSGTSASEIARVGKVMAQAGFRGDQLTEALTALSKVPLTPSFKNIDSAVEGTIAALNQFNKEGLKTEDILDTLSALEREFAASAEDLALGITKGGSAFQAIGGTFKEFASLMTVVRDVTRESSSTIGTFFKTFASRLADPRIVNFLEGRGIRISEAIESGDPVAAIKRIATALQNVTSIQEKMEIGTKLAGRRQISRFLALMNNMEKVDRALGIATNSAGTFTKIAEEGLKGLQAQLNILGQEFNKLVQTLAQPLFVPIIRGITTAGKALVTFFDFVKPIIPALTTIIGFAVGFKLLAISIRAAAKAMVFMSTVGIGGGIPGVLGAMTGAGAGGMAGATARERVKQRLAGGVSAGGAAVAGGAGARIAGGAGALAASKFGQLAIAAGLILAADKLSESFEETGKSSGVLAAEFMKAVGVILVAMSLLSGKSILGAISGMTTVLGPWYVAMAAATAAITAFTYATVKAVDLDVQSILDAAAKKVAEMPVEPIEVGDTEALEKAVSDLGLTAIVDGIQASAERYEEGLSGFFASAYERIKNLFQGEGLMTISDADAQKMIEDIVGENPKLLNKILRSAIEQFGVVGLETGLDQMLAEEFGSQVEAAARFRQAMIKQLGGLEKIASSIDQIKMDVKISKLATAIEKASSDFESLYVPVQLSHELSSLSDAVGKAARAIEMNVTMFDKLSQLVGQQVGVAKPGVEWSREAIEKIAGAGKMGEFIDLSQFEKLEGFTTDMARVGTALEKFMKSIIKSKANADSLRALLGDPKVDPFDILDDYIDKFMDEYPEKIPPEAEAAFKAAASQLGQQLKDMLIDEGGVLPSTEEVQKALKSVLGKQRPFYEAAIDVFKTWMDAQAQQINLAISGEELLAGVDVGTADMGKTIVASLQNALKNVGMDLKFPFTDINSIMVDLAQNGDVVGQVLEKYSDSYNKHAELNRKVAEAQKTGVGASLELLKASNDAAVEVLNLQIALSQLAKIAQQAPQALAKQQEMQRKLGYTVKEVQGVRVVGGKPGSEAAAARAMERIEKSSEVMSELINRQRQFIEAQAAIDIAQVFEEPADIFARALIDSAAAVRAFTSALTTRDLQRGAGALGARVTPEGRVYTERRPVPEAQVTEKEKIIETKQLQAALFGGDMGRVMETLLQAAAETAESKILGQLLRGRQEEATVNKELAKSFRDFKGFIYDIPKMISESGLDPEEVARTAAKALREQAEMPGAREVEYIGALRRTLSDLTDSLKTLIERPEVAREPEELIPQLTPAIQDYLESLVQPIGRVPEAEATPRVFEDISASAVDIQQAAAETRMAADITARSIEEMKIAAIDIKTGGTDILTASHGIIEAAHQMQVVSDIQREALIGQQKVVVGDIEGEGAKEAIVGTTDAVNALGDRMDAVALAVETQTQQQAELATAKEDKPLEIEGLDENTEAISTNNETVSKTQESMDDLNDGMNKIAGAIEEGVGVDIETMSEVKIDVQGVAMAAKEFTAEFEAVAIKVAKAEINKILQQLARSAGSSEASATFESAIQ